MQTTVKPTLIINILEKLSSFMKTKQVEWKSCQVIF